MTGGTPRVTTIPAGVSFVDALARGLLTRAGDPLELARGTVLLPTRRACRALQEAILRASDGRALLLPRLMPLGDVDAEELLLAGEEAPSGVADGGGMAVDLPPAMPPLRRQLLLGRLIQRLGKARGERLREDQAVRLADELGMLAHPRPALSGKNISASFVNRPPRKKPSTRVQTIRTALRRRFSTST